MSEILAECDSDDVLSEKDSDDEPEMKKHASRKQRVYLKEDEDSIIDFTSPSAHQNITSKSEFAVDCRRRSKIFFWRTVTRLSEKWEWYSSSV